MQEGREGVRDPEVSATHSLPGWVRGGKGRKVAGQESNILFLPLFPSHTPRNPQKGKTTHWPGGTGTQPDPPNGIHRGRGGST